MAIERTICEVCGEAVIRVPHSATGLITVVDPERVDGGTIVVDFQHGSWTRMATVRLRDDNDDATQGRSSRKRQGSARFYRAHSKTCKGIESMEETA